jgi:hypothetical protein
MFKNTAVILVSGKISSGKTTSSGILNKLFRDAGYVSTIANFAFGVKRIARLMGWNNVKDDRGRQLLIDIGMAGRKYDKDTWAKVTFDLYLPETDNYPFDVIIVDDWRFANEGKYLEDNPMFRVFKARVVDRGSDAFSNDESERGLPENYDAYDYIIRNSGTIEELNETMVSLFMDVKKEMEK